MTASEQVSAMFRASVPPDRVVDVVGWAEKHVKLPGSARSESFSSIITPWTREPISRIDDGHTRTLVFVKPVQSGGSVVGEVALCYWAAQKNGGDIQCNWPNDEAAEGRWTKRIERILKACKPVMARWPEERGRVTKNLVAFAHCNLMVQGIYTARRVASDTIKFQVNEEVHDEEGWLSGRLEQAFGRTTALWDAARLVISNAGRKDCELDKVFQDGTQQRWEVKCPSCGGFHVMRTRWNEKQPELGGLRYDSKECKREDGSYDYNRLAGTVRYQFPCGASIGDDIAIRRAMSLGGRYSEPGNTGASLTHRSYTLEAVAVDYIPWLSLIQQKHSALKALRYGDPEPWWKYLRERECIFADDSDRPLVGRVILSNARKNRDGLADRCARFAAIDRQQGKAAAGELPHWWLLIRDATPSGDSLLVYEGKCLDDNEVMDVLRQHQVLPRHVVVDSGYDSTHVYRFCLAHGFNAIKGDARSFFAHADGGRRIFSEERALHLMLNMPATRPDSPADEPLFWFYSKNGIRDRLHWLRGGGAVKWEVPEDVSQNYLSHMESEELVTERDARGRNVTQWVQFKPRNDLLVCECYIAMLMDMAGLIGSQVPPDNFQKEQA